MKSSINMTAFGYYNSKLIKKIGVEPVLGLAAQPPRLFYHSEFVPNHNYWKCFQFLIQITLMKKHVILFLQKIKLLL